MLEFNSSNATTKALLITFSLLKLVLNGSDISISAILKILLSALVIRIELNSKVDKQIIAKDKNLKNIILVYIF